MNIFELGIPLNIFKSIYLNIQCEFFKYDSKWTSCSRQRCDRCFGPRWGNADGSSPWPSHPARAPTLGIRCPKGVCRRRHCRWYRRTRMDGFYHGYGHPEGGLNNCQAITRKIAPCEDNKETKKAVDLAPPPEPTEAPMDTLATEKRAPTGSRKTPAKRLEGKQPSQEEREFLEDPPTTTKPPLKRRARGKQPPSQPALRTINTPRGNKTTDVEEAPRAKEETQASSTKTPVKKANKDDVIAPHRVGIQVMQEKFEEMNKRSEIEAIDYKRFQEIYKGWKTPKGRERKKNLRKHRNFTKRSSTQNYSESD